jgi:LysR family hydrogen peroxide-inducible transcriptional activator
MIRLTVRQLEYFAALAELRHFGRAAAQCGVTQPALSSQLAEMEARLGCKLFERGGRVVTMTAEADRLRPRIERVLAELREIQASAQTGRGVLEGPFRLGIIPTVAPYLLPRVLPAVRQRYPKLRLELREAITDRLVEETVAGRLDGFVAALPIDEPRLESRPLFADRFFLAVPLDDPDLVEPPVAPEDAALERLMLLEEGHCMREQALAVCGKARPAAMANYGATSLTTLLQMVAHGHGVTLIPEIAAQDDLAAREIRVVPFREPVPARTICMAWRRNGARLRDCGLLAEIIAETAAPARGDKAAAA